MSLTMGLVLAASLVVGALIGGVGIGGVLLPPILMYVGGLDPHLAAATGMWAFLFTGVAGTLTYAKRRSIDWRMAAWLGTGAIPAAFVGARANAALPDQGLLILLAALTAAAGADALLRPAVTERPRSFGTPGLIGIGVVVGFGSALTGTGGPVLLVPILLFLRAPVLAAVGAAQVVQLPVAASATIGYVLFGRVDFVLGTALGMVAVAGVAIGSQIAHVAPPTALRRVVAISLVGAGLMIGTRAAGGLAAAASTSAPATVAEAPHQEAITQADKPWRLIESANYDSADPRRLPPRELHPHAHTPRPPAAPGR